MKVYGAGAVLCASFLFAYARLAEKKREIALLAGLCGALDRMYAELSSALTPLPGVIAQAAVPGSGPASSFFFQLLHGFESLDERDFRQIWEEAAKKHLKELRAEDLSALVELGSWLGRYTLEEQLAALDRCRQSLRESCNSRRASYQSERKLSYGLSFVAGCFLTILLL